MDADVVVVGAGMAGLACAIDLRAAGLDALVLESSERPGGRVRTISLNGRWVETGAEWIDTSHGRVHALLGRYGLRAVGDAPPWWEREAGWVDDDDGPRPKAESWEPGTAQELARWDAWLDDAAAGIADPADPAGHEDAIAIDARSAADLFSELDLRGQARFLLQREIAFEYTCEPEDISVLFLAQQRAVVHGDAARVGDVRSQRVDGGLSGLACAMADDLGDVRFGTRVQRVEHDGDGVCVRTASGSFTARHAVLACAPPPLRRIEIDPAPDGAFGEGIARLGFGAVIKTFVAYPDRPWRFPWVVTSRFLQRVYDPAEEQTGAAGVLDAYIGGEGARAFLREVPDEAERVQRVRDELATIVPGIEGGEGASRAWEADPDFGGSFSVYEPGQVTAFWRAMREPHGRLWLAGEHVATVTGYVEGAVERGQAVAAALVTSRA
jgi:monoamine oxidase